MHTRPSHIQFHQQCPLNHSASCSTLYPYASFDFSFDQRPCHSSFSVILDATSSLRLLTSITQKTGSSVLMAATIYFFHSTFHAVIAHCLYSLGHGNLPGSHVSFITAFPVPQLKEHCYQLYILLIKLKLFTLQPNCSRNIFKPSLFLLLFLSVSIFGFFFFFFTKISLYQNFSLLSCQNICFTILL